MVQFNDIFSRLPAPYKINYLFTFIGLSLFTGIWFIVGFIYVIQGEVAHTIWKEIE